MSFGNHVNTNVSKVNHNILVISQPCQFTHVNEVSDNTILKNHVFFEQKVKEKIPKMTNVKKIALSI